MTKCKMTVVIHAEEEFDWSGGYYRSNTKVNHGTELVEFTESLLQAGAKIILAMDYAFVNSAQGSEVIDHFKCKNYHNLEFGTHLHPWVNPPFDEPSIDGDKIDEIYSYPGNLPVELEEKKLEKLTSLISEKTEKRPTIYLAGRYGVGKNSYQLLSKLGYKLDVSISAFANFSEQHGPDFSEFTNDEIEIAGIKCIPHTSGYISYFNSVSNYFNKRSDNLHKLNNSFIGKVILKLLGVKRVRLSPEGYSYNEMKRLIDSLMSMNVENLIFSFHSPSVKSGLTPYIQNESHLSTFKNDTKRILAYFNKLTGDN